MLIAVEGPDGAGKTTFTKVLMDCLRLSNRDPQLIHHGPPQTWPVSEYELAVQSYRPGRGVDLIFDRLHVGEMVYGPVLRGRTGMTEAGYEHVNGLMATKGLVTVFLMPPQTEVERNLGERGDDLVDVQQLSAIYEGYGERMRSYKLPRQALHRYPTEDNAWRVLKLAARIEQLQMDTAKFASLVGWMFPEVLFVGDKRSDMADLHEQAFVPWPGRSGEFLMESVIQRYFTWAMINASEDSVAEAVRVLRPQAVVALGNVANRACKTAEVAHRMAPHPAYALRWQGMSVNDYQELI